MSIDGYTLLSLYVRGNVAEGFGLEAGCPRDFGRGTAMGIAAMAIAGYLIFNGRFRNWGLRPGVFGFRAIKVYLEDHGT